MPQTPKAGETTAEQFEKAAEAARLSPDARFSTYREDDSDELKDQNPPHGPQVIQERGEPKETKEK